MKREGKIMANIREYNMKTTSHCLIFCQRITGGLCPIKSEGKFTQSMSMVMIEKDMML